MTRHLLRAWIPVAGFTTCVRDYWFILIRLVSLAAILICRETTQT